MSEQLNNHREINNAVLEVGKGSLHIIQQFLSGRVSRESMVQELESLRVDNVLNQYWDELTSDAKYVPHWHVLQTLQGIAEEMAYQFAEYGDSTLFDDLNEIARNLKRITDIDKDK